MSIRSMSTSTLTKQERYAKMSGAFGPRFGNLECVVVAGGGSSSNISTGGLTFDMGGAGAGGYRSTVPGESSGGGASPETLISDRAGQQTFTVTVGAGGAPNVNGEDSVFSSITSLGGGNAADQDGEDGGSGGGAGSRGGIGGVGSQGQGFNGGNSTGGGGGAGQAGNTNGGGFGGDGTETFITGNGLFLAGGGAAGRRSTGGGLGGGGNGSSGEGSGENGAPNTGGGGGGGFVNNGGVFAGTNGGSGVVIFAVAANRPVSFSAGVTHTSSTVGDQDVYTVTATSTTSETVTIG